MIRAEQAIVEAFHTLYYADRREGLELYKRTFWMGTPVQKCPLDLWVCQELLYEVRPDLVIETGTYAGGSALYIAHVLDILGHGAIVTIDVEERPRPTHPRITYVHGSSGDPTVAAAVQREHPADRVVVILDADHSAAHVRQEFSLFAPRVNVGSYLIVEDTNVNGHPVSPTFGDGPYEAITAFLAVIRNSWWIPRERSSC